MEVALSLLEAELVRCAEAERRRAMSDAERVFQLRVAVILDQRGWKKAAFKDGPQGAMVAELPDE